MDEGPKKSGGPSVVALRYLAAILTAAAFVGGAGWLLQRRSKRRKGISQLDGDEDADEAAED